MGTQRTFASDNFSTVDPGVMRYLDEVNCGHSPSYGSDEISKQAQRLFTETFGHPSQVMFVPTGTGANILGLSLLLTRPYDALITSQVSHVYEEETGALARHAGAHTFPLPHQGGKLDAKQIKREIQERIALEFHSARPKVVSIANSTEFGTYYTPDEVRAIAKVCHDHGVYLHMDGCRLANVVAALGCTLRECTSDAGVDVLSFGGAKNGLMSAEAVVTFADLDVDLLRSQKQTMQLVSKARYVSGQFVPYLRDNLWLKNARRANQLARLLAATLRAELGEAIQLTAPVDTNQVFCVLPPQAIERLRSAGHEFYDWPGQLNQIRLVTSWDSTEEDIAAFAEVARG